MRARPNGKCRSVGGRRTAEQRLAALRRRGHVAVGASDLRHPRRDPDRARSDHLLRRAEAKSGLGARFALPHVGGMTPKTRYAYSDDVCIAYQMTGEGPPDVIWAPGTMSHLDM